MANDVVVTLSVNDLNSIKSIKALTSQLEAMKQKLKQLKSESESTNAAMISGTKTLVSQLGQAAIKVGSLAAGYLSARTALQSLMKAQDEFNNKSREKGIAFDEAFRKFRIQSGLQGNELTAAQRSIEQTAVKVAMDPIEVAGIAEQLVSSGFDAKQAQGPALESFLKLMAGTNQAMTARGDAPVSTKDLVQATSSYMNNLGLEKTSASIERFATVAQTAFKKTNLQLEDFAELAPEAAVMKDVMPLETQVGMMSVLRDVIPSGAESSTAIRNIVLKTTAITEPTRLEALSKTGVAAKEIDGIGEDYISGLKKLREGLSKLPEEEQRKVAKVMFEERTVAPFMTLMQAGRLEEIERRAKDFQDRQQYEKDVEIATTGKAAQERRLQAQEDIRIAKEGQDRSSVEAVLRAARAADVARGSSEVWASVKQAAASVAVMGGQLAGLTPEYVAAEVMSPGWRVPFAESLVGTSRADPFEAEIYRRLREAKGTEPTAKLEPVKQTRTPAERIAILEAIGKELRSDKDQSISPNEADQFRERVAIAAESTGATAEQSRAMMDLTRTLKDLIAKLQDNSKKTEANTKASTAPRPQVKVDSKPPIQPSARSKNFSLSQERDSKVTVR